MKRTLALILLSAATVFGQGAHISQSPWVSSRQGNPVSGASIAVCQAATTTAATVTSNLAVFTTSSNPQTLGFVAGMTLMVSGFTGGDVFFNTGTLANGALTSGLPILSVTPTTVTVSLVHANANATTNGSLVQFGNSVTSCAGLATIYTDASLATTTPNPFLSDSLGNYDASVPAGVYYVQVYGSGVTTTLRQITVPLTPNSTFANINNVLYVGTGTGQYATLQAAHDALPATGGTIFVMANGTPFGATALAATKPMHVIFDCANFTYSGSAAQAISTTSRGVIIEGCGRRGDDIGTAGTTITVTNIATNGITNSGNGATFQNFNLIGPASGTGKGVINTAGRATYSNLNISSFGSDGWTNDGSATNANTVLVSKVRSSSNGGNGFVTKGVNGQLTGFIECDGSANTGDGWNISNQLNMFFGDNADNDSGVGYHFVSGGSNNTGSFDPDAGGAITFDAGANNNTFYAVTNVIPTDNGAGNAVYNVLSTSWITTGQSWSSRDRDLALNLNSGTGGGIRGSSINLQDNAVNKWTVQKTTANGFAIADTGTLNRIAMTGGAQTDINAGGTTAVRFNVTALAATSTAGVEFYSGGASSAKVAQATAGGLLVDVNAVTPCTNGELALSANWGNTGAPTVTAVAGTGQTCQWTITAGGAATGVSPTITDTLTNALPTATTVCDMRMVGGTGTATLINQTSLSATAPIFTFGGTPGAGLTYIVVRRCGP